VEISILDIETNEKTILNLNDIVYIEEGVNKKNNRSSILIKLKSGRQKVFEMSYDVFVSKVNELLVENGWEGILIEEKF
jgi:hypothetical protein